MARDLGLPVFGNGVAAEELGKEVGEEVAEDEKSECVGGVAEAGVDAEEAEVEEEDAEFVAEEGEEVDWGGDVDPLRWVGGGGCQGSGCF